MDMINIALTSYASRYKPHGFKSNINSPSLKNTDYDKQIVNADTKNFAGSNADLISFITYNEDLNKVFHSRKIANSSELRDIIVNDAMEKLDGSNPISESFLKEHLDFAKFISANIGNITDILNTDSKLTRKIATNGDVYGDAILSKVTDEVSYKLGRSSVITERFLSDNPSAAIHLMLNPSEISSLRNDSAEAREFIANFGRKVSTYNTEIAERAKSILDRPATFTLDYLEGFNKFAQVVVASSLHEGNQSLSQYIRANPELVQDDFTDMDLLKLYQASLARSKFSDNFPLTEGFFEKNSVITSAVILSDTFTTSLKEETSRLGKYFSADRYSIESRNNLAAKLSGIYNSPYKSYQTSQISISLFA